MEERAFCDARGRYPQLDPAEAERYEFEVDLRMRAEAGADTPRHLATPGITSPGGDGLQANGRAWQPPPPRSDAFLNLRAFMNCAPMSVRPDTPASRVHSMFLSLGLRHLCVTDRRGYLLGIVTRKDLDAAAGIGWWRMHKLAGPPAPSPLSQRLRRSTSWLQDNLSRLRSPGAATQPLLPPGGGAGPERMDWHAP